MNGIWVEDQYKTRIKIVGDIRVEKYGNYTHRILCDGYVFGSFDSEMEFNMFMSMLTRFINMGGDEFGDIIFHIPTQKEMGMRVKEANRIIDSIKGE